MLNSPSSAEFQNPLKTKTDDTVMDQRQFPIYLDFYNPMVHQHYITPKMKAIRIIFTEEQIEMGEKISSAFHLICLLAYVTMS